MKKKLNLISIVLTIATVVNSYHPSINVVSGKVHCGKGQVQSFAQTSKFWNSFQEYKLKIYLKGEHHFNLKATVSKVKKSVGQGIKYEFSKASEKLQIKKSLLNHPTKLAHIIEKKLQKLDFYSFKNCKKMV